MRRTNVLSGLISIIIISLIVLAGPTNAFILDLSLEKNQIKSGEKLTLSFSAEIESNEVVNVQKFALVLRGPQNLTCEFLPNGQKISACSNLQITQVSSSPFGYGYGYGYNFGYGYLPGFLKYKITLDSNSLEAGDYIMKLSAFTESAEFTSTEKEITVLGKIDRQCSIRAKRGEITFNNQTFNTKNSLNFFTSPKGKNSRGFLTVQGNKLRLTYNFMIKNLRTENDILVFETEGTIKENINQKSGEKALIKYDPANREIEIQGNSFQGENMKVTFVNC